MIQLGILLPLAVGGVIVGVWRKYLDNQVQRVALDLPALETNRVQDNTENPPHVYDDVGELQHSQQVSLYSLALTASGTWFYAPIVTLASIPLLGYSAYHFITIMRHSDAADRKKPFAISIPSPLSR